MFKYRAKWLKSFEIILFHQVLVFIPVWLTGRESSETLREIKITQTLYSSSIFLLPWLCFQFYVIPPDFWILTLANLLSEMTTSVSFALYWSELVITIANKMWAPIH